MSNTCIFWTKFTLEIVLFLWLKCFPQQKLNTNPMGNCINGSYVVCLCCKIFCHFVYRPILQKFCDRGHLSILHKTLSKVWVLVPWTWERGETSWQPEQISSPGSPRLSSLFCSYLALWMTLRCACGNIDTWAMGRYQCNGIFFLMVGYHWKPSNNANGCISNIIDYSIAPTSYNSLYLLMLQVIYLTLTSCSFPILYYTSIESNMERMWITVEHLASLGAKIFKKSADWVSVFDWTQYPRKNDFDRTIWIFVIHMLGYRCSSQKFCGLMTKNYFIKWRV